MKTLLNILPEEKKEQIQKRLRLRFLLWQLFLLLLLELFYFGILMSIFVILDTQFRSTQSITSSIDESHPEEVRLTNYQSKFKETNMLVDTAGKIDRSHIYFSKVFILLDTLLPTGIILEQLTTRDYLVSLAGTAVKREDFLRMEEQLKGATDCIKNINIPVSNLFSQENIKFQVSFSVVPTCLKSDRL